MLNCGDNLVTVVVHSSRIGDSSLPLGMMKLEGNKRDKCTHVQCIVMFVFRNESCY